MITAEVYKNTTNSILIEISILNTIFWQFPN